MNCPKCGLTIDGSASSCPRCLINIPKGDQNYTPVNNSGNKISHSDNVNQNSYNQDSSAAESQYGGMSYWVGQCFKKYATFGGRSRRKEYWNFNLIIILISIVFTILSQFSQIFSIINLIVALPLIIPGWAVLVRRLHDTGRSGVYVLIGLIPIVGPFILLAWVLKDSASCDNIYGPYPK